MKNREERDTRRRLKRMRKNTFVRNKIFKVRIMSESEEESNSWSVPRREQ